MQKRSNQKDVSETVILKAIPLLFARLLDISMVIKSGD